MTNETTQTVEMVGYHIGCDSPVLRMPVTGREICRDCGVTPMFITRELSVQWAGASVTLYCPVENREVKHFAVRKNVLVRAAKWASDRGMKLSNVRDGAVWL